MLKRILAGLIVAVVMASVAVVKSAANDQSV
jgi:hypothetical protein